MAVRNPTQVAQAKIANQKTDASDIKQVASSSVTCCHSFRQPILQKNLDKCTKASLLRPVLQGLSGEEAS